MLQEARGVGIHRPLAFFLAVLVWFACGGGSAELAKSKQS